MAPALQRRCHWKETIDLVFATYQHSRWVASLLLDGKRYCTLTGVTGRKLWGRGGGSGSTSSPGLLTYDPGRDTGEESSICWLIDPEPAADVLLSLFVVDHSCLCIANCIHQWVVNVKCVFVCEQLVAQGQFRVLKVPLGFIKALQWVSGFTTQHKTTQHPLDHQRRLTRPQTSPQPPKNRDASTRGQQPEFVTF